MASLGAGAGAACQVCLHPFEGLEDMRAPYFIECGHITCIGCLNSANSICLICGAAFDGQALLRLLDVVRGQAYSPAQTSGKHPDDNVVGQRLQEAIALVNETTSFSYIRMLYQDALRFLDSQPRNRFTALDTSVRLLGCVLHAKNALRSQAALTNGLTKKFHQLHEEKREAARRLAELEGRHAAEIKFAVDNVRDIMRRDVDFNLVSDEVIELRRELNDMKDVFHRLRRVHHRDYPDLFSSPYTASNRSVASTPRIRVHPASRSPTPAEVAFNVNGNTNRNGNSAENSTPGYGMSPLIFDRGDGHDVHSNEARPFQLFEHLNGLNGLNELDFASSARMRSNGSSLNAPDTPPRPTLSDLDSDSDSDRGDHIDSTSAFNSTARVHRPYDTQYTGNARASFDARLHEGPNAAGLNSDERFTGEQEGVIHQPRAVYPASNHPISNTVRFNIPLETEYEPSHSYTFDHHDPNNDSNSTFDSIVVNENAEQEAGIIGTTPNSPEREINRDDDGDGDEDSLMNMSTSSLGILKTPELSMDSFSNIGVNFDSGIGSSDNNMLQNNIQSNSRLEFLSPPSASRGSFLPPVPPPPSTTIRMTPLFAHLNELLADSSQETVPSSLSTINTSSRASRTNLGTSAGLARLGTQLPSRGSSRSRRGSVSSLSSNSRAVTRSKSYPNIRGSRPWLGSASTSSNPIVTGSIHSSPAISSFSTIHGHTGQVQNQGDTGNISHNQLVAGVRACFVEALARVLVHLVTPADALGSVNLNQTSATSAAGSIFAGASGLGARLLEGAGIDLSSGDSVSSVRSEVVEVMDTLLDGRGAGRRVSRVGRYDGGDEDRSSMVPVVDGATRRSRTPS